MSAPDSGLLQLSLTGLAQAIRSRKVSSVEATRACIARAEQVQPRLNCFVGIEAEQALKAARLADRAVSAKRTLGLLHGVPLAHKDMYYRAGLVSNCGSAIMRGYRPAITATVVERLQAAGAIWLGTLSMCEFAADATGNNELWGHCRNPWNPAHITGGSSSGSGAALAARACFGALGSDTGGSIRLPAAFCGVTGIKPTYGRVSRYGAMPRVWSNDCVGPLARSARDCARLLRVIAGRDPNDSTSSAEPVPDYESGLAAGIKGLRIAVPENFFYDGVTADVARAMEESLAALRSLGARIVRVQVPDPQRLGELQALTGQCEAATLHARSMRERPQDFSVRVRRRLEAGYHIPAVTYLEAQDLRAPVLTEFVRTVFGNADMLHTPMLPFPTPSIESCALQADGTIPRLVGEVSRNAKPFNYLGLPAIALPGGFSDDRLPVGFQLVGRPFSEHLLLRAGQAFQSATDWHKLSPAL